MVQTVILHVGPHKTGTTALQATFAGQADLLARNGVIYPRTGRDNFGHAPLAEALLTGDRSGLDNLVHETRGWRAVLMSSEHFSAMDEDCLLALRASFPGAEFRIAYALRRLVDLWPSHWAELVKHGQPLSFAGYLDRIRQGDDRPFHAAVLPARQLDRLAAVFGIAALRLIDYDQLRSEGQDLGPAFIDDLFGFGHIAPAFVTGRTNPSPSDLETTLVYRMNRHAGSRANHLIRRAARLVLLDRLRADPPPPWLAAVRIALDRGGRITLNTDHPLVATEQQAVASRFRALLADGPNAYLAPSQRSVPDVEDLPLDAATDRALATTFDAALSAVQPDWSPP